MDKYEPKTLQNNIKCRSNALNFINNRLSCQIEIGSESVYIQSGFDWTFAFDFVTAIHRWIQSLRVNIITAVLLLGPSEP